MPRRPTKTFVAVAIQQFFVSYSAFVLCSRTLVTWIPLMNVVKASLKLWQHGKINVQLEWKVLCLKSKVTVWRRETWFQAVKLLTLLSDYRKGVFVFEVMIDKIIFTPRNGCQVIKRTHCTAKVSFFFKRSCKVIFYSYRKRTWTEIHFLWSSYWQRRNRQKPTVDCFKKCWVAQYAQQCWLQICGPMTLTS